MIYVLPKAWKTPFTVHGDEQPGIKLRNSDVLKAQNLKDCQNDRAAQAKGGRQQKTISARNSMFFCRTYAPSWSSKGRREPAPGVRGIITTHVTSTQTYPQTTAADQGKATFDFIDRHYRHYLALFDQDHFSVAQSYKSTTSSP